MYSADEVFLAFAADIGQKACRNHADVWTSIGQACAPDDVADGAVSCTMVGGSTPAWSIKSSCTQVVGVLADLVFEYSRGEVTADLSCIVGGFVVVAANACDGVAAVLNDAFDAY